MKIIDSIFRNNKSWSSEIKKNESDFFLNLNKKQNPKFIWIGCSDSRVPPNQICGLSPGDIFVYRNIANMISVVDISLLSMLEYGLCFLNIENIILCAHYNCGGVGSVFQNNSNKYIGSWLNDIKNTCESNKKSLKRITDSRKKINKLVELNLSKQIFNLCSIPVVQDQWKKHKKLSVYGLIYNLNNGLFVNSKIIKISTLDEMEKFNSNIIR
jgi:carbonic anhydrase